MAHQAQQAQRATDDQKRFLVSYMERHPAFCQKEFNSAQGTIHMRQTWEKLADMLNEIEHGAHKTVEQWMRYWTDQKKTVKNNAARIKRSLARGTGGGPPPTGLLSHYEERVLNCMGGWVRVEGFTQVVDPLEVDPLEFVPPPVVLQPPTHGQQGFQRLPIQQVLHPPAPIPNKRMRLNEEQVDDINMDWIMDNAATPSSFLDHDELMSIPLDFWTPVLPSSSQQLNLSSVVAPASTATSSNVQQQHVLKPVVHSSSTASSSNVQQQRILKPVVHSASTATSSNVHQQQRILKPVVHSASTATSSNVQQQSFLKPVVHSASTATSSNVQQQRILKPVVHSASTATSSNVHQQQRILKPVVHSASTATSSNVQQQRFLKPVVHSASTATSSNVQQQRFLKPVVHSASTATSSNVQQQRIILKPVVHSASTATSSNVQQQRFLKPVVRSANIHTAKSASATILQSNLVPISRGNVQQLRFYSPVEVLGDKQKLPNAPTTSEGKVSQKISGLPWGNMQQQPVLKPASTANVQHQLNPSPVVGKQTTLASSAATFPGKTVETSVGPRNYSSPVMVQSHPAILTSNAQQHFLSSVNKQTTQSASAATGINEVQKITSPSWSTPLKKNLKSPPVATSTPVKLAPTAGSSSIIIDGVKYLVLNRRPLTEVNPNGNPQ